ncbi:MAG: glycogen debranching enzyme N-terminal domain-containing protein [Candidatus Brocadia sp.]|jgi:glycogen debranching enzyme
MTIVFNEDICHDIPKAIEKEWLETNGIGGYASSTIIGANTRRYHGLLMAATRPPLGRTLLLSKLEEFLYIEGKEFPLSTNVYPHAIYPSGYENLTQFSLKPFLTFNYSINGINIKKIVFMVHGENTTVILYQVDRSGELPFTLTMKVRVMVAFRDYHWLTHENPSFKTDYKFLANGICLQPYDALPPLYLYFNAQSMDKASFWYKNMEYPKEIERGMDAHEDHFSPFALHFDLNKGNDCYVMASTKEYDTLDIPGLVNKEIERRKNVYEVEPLCSQIENRDRGLGIGDRVTGHKFLSPDIRQPTPITKLAQLRDSLLSVSDSFIVKRGSNKKSIIAGYHWFGDWGRDTMISLPGLTLVQGRFEEAKEILLSYAQFVDKGMIPNRFPDYGEMPEYNTVDASLWYIHAVYQYLRFAKDLKTIRKDLYSVLKEIIGYYRKGTRYNIHMDSDGLIHAGAEGVQLTWMDAKVGDWVVTPRRGKAVEINALWYNALKIMAFFAREMNLNEEGNDYNSLAQKASESFNNVFWFEEGQYLYDYIDGETRDRAIRPNQIFTVSLPYSMLSIERQRKVVEIVKEHLLTPFGLRSLSPKDKGYIGKYQGNVYERDSAYHQGTVWAWLIGPYISAYARAYAGSEDTPKYIKGLFEPFYAHLFEAGLGTISEIFDGDYPHTPRGCISQAWSVAEILRTYFEHIHTAQ